MVSSFGYRISKSNGEFNISAKRIDNSNSNWWTDSNWKFRFINSSHHIVNVANAYVLFAFTGDGSKYNASVTVTTNK
jgi:hypothetical protein